MPTFHEDQARGRQSCECAHAGDIASLTTYEDVAVVVLAGADPDRAELFARTALGDLFDARPELREALRIHLLEHRSATRAARRMYTDRNTVLNRVKNAEALLPRPLDEHPSPSPSPSSSTTGST